MQLEGNKVILRPITIEDTSNMVKWRNQDFVMKNFIDQNPLTPEIHLNWLKTKVEKNLVKQFIIIVKDGSRPIGSVYLRDVDYKSGIAEYGILIGEEDALGKGYGTESCKMMVEFAKQELGLNRLILRLRRNNEIAHKSYLSAGFKDTYNALENDEIFFMEKIL